MGSASGNLDNTTEARRDSGLPSGIGSPSFDRSASDWSHAEAEEPLLKAQIVEGLLQSIENRSAASLKYTPQKSDQATMYGWDIRKRKHYCLRQ